MWYMFKSDEKKIIRICPDFDCYIWEGDAALDLEDLLDRRGNPVVVPALDAWAGEIAPAILALQQGCPCKEPDWADFHKRGLALTRQLRRRLSSDYELWYEPPVEDKSGTITERVKIDEVPESVVIEAGGYYLQWVLPEQYRGEDICLFIHHIDCYTEDYTGANSYTISPGNIYYEEAGFTPGIWDIEEGDMWLRISKEQYEAWQERIEDMKIRMFALADGHTCEKGHIDTGDVIMTDAAFYKIVDVKENLKEVKVESLYMNKLGIQFDNEADWISYPTEIEHIKRGIHVDDGIFENAADMAREFTKNLIDELIECIYTKQQDTEKRNI